MDSASNYLQDNPDKSIHFLKKIPVPLETTIKGNVAEYYESLAFAYYHKDNFGSAYRYMLLSASYAEKENKLKFAGELYVEAYTLNRQIEKKSNESLLEKAQKNFLRVKDTDGLLEVSQARIYGYYVDQDYQRCLDSSLLLLNDFKKADNLMISLVANYLVASCYIRMDSLTQGLNYYKTVLMEEEIEANGHKDYYFHETALNFDLAKYYLRKKNIDSCLSYFNKVGQSKKVLDYTKERDYYQLGIEINRYAKNQKKVIAFMDSLHKFERLNVESSLKESLTVNENLVKLSENLDEAKLRSKFYLFNLIGASMTTIIMLILIIIYRRKIKKGMQSLKSTLEESFNSKKNHQKLSTKINELEGYISEIKTEVKNISKEESENIQRTKLQNLYKEINLKSSELSVQDHLSIMNEFNEPYFERLKVAHPDLNESELIICYYLFLGFKNKEIASHLNSTVRSIEGKRFRIRTKTNTRESQNDLIDYLNDLMKGLEITGKKA
ncbi:MAG: helix-turn-helix transcriptional regulator [Bacteroidota bacterium]